GLFDAATPTVSGSLNAIRYHDFFNSFVAVGTGGAIVSGDNTTPAVRASNTTANLRAVDYDADASPSYHVAGDGGVWLTSANRGVNWAAEGDKPGGNVRGIAVKRDPAGAAGDFHVWTVGETQRVQMRPSQPPSGPFVSFYPGKLDFGFL